MNYLIDLLILADMVEEKGEIDLAKLLRTGKLNRFSDYVCCDIEVNGDGSGNGDENNNSHGNGWIGGYGRLFSGDGRGFGEGSWDEHGDGFGVDLHVSKIEGKESGDGWNSVGDEFWRW